MLPKVLNSRFIKISKDHFRNIKRCLNTEGTHMKTDLQLLTRNDESNYLYINAYSALGFTLSSETRVWGPIALFPKTVLHWNVKGPAYINEASLSLFPLLVPKLDIVVIGYGDRNNKVNNNIFRFMKSHNINVEILPTETACATFNFLNLERRYVAAGLIPVADDIQITDNEEFEHPAQLNFLDTDITLVKGKGFIDAGREIRRRFKEEKEINKENKTSVEKSLEDGSNEKKDDKYI